MYRDDYPEAAAKQRDSCWVVAWRAPDCVPLPVALTGTPPAA